MEPEADRHWPVPEPSRLLEVGVRDTGELAQDTPGYLEERVTDRLDRTYDSILRLRVGLSVLLELCFCGLGRVSRAVSVERAAAHPQKAVFGSEHVVERFTQRPLPLGRRPIEILTAHGGEDSREI